MFAHNRAYTMVTHPKRLVFAGIFVAALAVTSYLPRLMQSALHHNHSASDGYDDAGSVSAMPDSVPASGAVSAEMRTDESPARILQAVRDSLQRNDLASAEVLLRAARTLDMNNPQAIALQHDLDARVAQSAAPTTSGKGVVASQRTESGAIPRASRTVERAAQKREPVHRAPLHAREAQSRAAENTVTNTPPETVTSTPEVIEKPKPAIVDAVPEVVHAPAPVVESSPVIVQQTVRPAPAPVVESSTGPKTREQVRAELERARTDGSLPRFGNPDPAGPGVATISKPSPSTLNR
ncbi:hypothetical protein ASG35_22265 [Burkholderia sp. Leaf177]|nr:hypothetical protein ASG35_22265 [Burkholderia sp. Leaf177]